VAAGAFNGGTLKGHVLVKAGAGSARAQRPEIRTFLSGGARTAHTGTVRVGGTAACGAGACVTGPGHVPRLVVARRSGG
jgi:hypothetical protein